MKKTLVLGMSLSLVLISFLSCGKKAEAPKAGSASAEDMLSLVPEDSMGVICIDLHRAMTTEFVDKIIKEDENYQKYQEFVGMTSIDPQKDIFFVTVAIMKPMEKKEPQGGAIVNLKYDKESILSLIKDKAAKEGQELMEEDYNGMMIYSLSEEKGEEDYFSFLDDSNIVAGNGTVVKSILDVVQKTKENVFKNKELSSLIDKTNKAALLWGSILIPAEIMSQVASENPMLKNLEAVKATSMYFDYKNKNLTAEVMVISEDEEKNKQVADLLNGVKSMGGMVAAQKPEVGELLNKIEITSSADHVKIFARIPEELLNKLKEMKEKEE